MILYEIENINETDYVLTLTDKTKNTFLLDIVFKNTLNKARRELKAKGVDMPSVDYKQLDNWSTRQLDEKNLALVRKMFNNPVIAHYRCPISNIKEECSKEGFKFLSFNFEHMSFRKTKDEWEIITTLTGLYEYNPK